MLQVRGVPQTWDNIAPIPMECDAPFLTIKGELPRELNGTLYRNGANPQFISPNAHWFFGDGMLHAFHLENGRASYRNRWVRTPKWLAEHAAGRPLYGEFNMRLKDAPASTPRDGNVANTNVVYHAGRLLALEEAHLPMQIERETLETRGYCDYGGALQGPFTAHPKIDPVTGEMLFFGYNVGRPLGRGMMHGAIDASGRLTRLERFKAPYSAMVHDFIVTAKHVLFPILPLTGSIWRAVRGKPPYAWEPRKGSYVGVMPRSGSVRNIRWFRTEPCFVFHVMNAWDEGNTIIADVMQSEAPPFFTDTDGRSLDPDKSRARLCRWTFDLAGRSDSFQRSYLDDINGEFPRIDERRAGLHSRHGWYACMNPEAPDVLSGLVHVGGDGERRARYFLPIGDTIGEPVFVPRSRDSGEADGWLLAVVWRGCENRSDLAVFNASDIAAGPIALVQLGHRIPDGFHGNWVAAD
ncbi:carotenoid oxygenase family protein [Rhodopseudomonas palustris]|uniref:carotenoid oxygenase family protein n=1 Tax=Rhodopseudomonas palustris TaxID=1076 RepID=UPI0021F33FC7|nr:carotenoid oxygenase family protein [Rhodopseudomonas palustris]UYO55035.1 carotenoid oxygenase family protein [Rhodopseudomonas palustris]